MQKSFLLLIFVVLALTFVSAEAKKSCRVVRSSKCQTKRVPYLQAYRASVPYYKVQKYIKSVRVPYNKRVCKQKRRKVVYNVPYKARKVIKVRKYQKYRQYYNKRVSYLVTLRRRRKVFYDQKYKVRVLRKFTVYYKVRQVKKVYKNRRAICYKRYTKRFSKQVRKYYKSHCYKYVRRLRFVKKRVAVLKSFRKKYWTGRYQASGTPGCYKKVYAYKYYKKRVLVWRKVARYVRVKVRYQCVKSKLVTVYYKKNLVKKYNCVKRRLYYVPYYVRKSRVVRRYVTVTKTRKLFRWVPYTVVKRRYKTVRRYRIKVRSYWASKTITVFKYRRSYRWETYVVTVNVRRYRRKYVVSKRRVRAYKTVVKRRRAYKNVRVCVPSYKKVCKTVGY